MKKLIIFSIALMAIVIMLNAGWTFKKDFLATAVNCALSTTLVNGTDFTSEEVTTGRAALGAITITFTRAAGTSATVDFEFQASTDGGATWTTAYYVQIQVATNDTAVSNVVRSAKPVNLGGISSLRLYRIVNNDAANNVTACNAVLSY